MSLETRLDIPNIQNFFNDPPETTSLTFLNSPRHFYKFHLGPRGLTASTRLNICFDWKPVCDHPTRDCGLGAGRAGPVRGRHGPTDKLTAKKHTRLFSRCWVGDGGGEGGEGAII